MKNLELNEMENIQGGLSWSWRGCGIGAVIGGIASWEVAGAGAIVGCVVGGLM